MCVLCCRFRSGCGRRTAGELFPELFNPLLTATPVAVVMPTAKPALTPTASTPIESSTGKQAARVPSFVCSSRDLKAFRKADEDVVLDDEAFIDICFDSPDRVNGAVFRVNARRVTYPDGETVGHEVIPSKENPPSQSAMQLDSAADTTAPETEKGFQLVGLRNPGSLCYVNTLVQLLSYSPVFISVLRAYEGASLSVLALRELALALHRQPLSSPSCEPFFRACASWWNTSSSRGQEDVQEFFHALMRHIVQDNPRSRMFSCCEWNTQSIKTCQRCKMQECVSQAWSFAFVLPISPVAQQLSCCMTVDDALKQFCAAKACEPTELCRTCQYPGMCSLQQKININAKLLHIYFDRVKWNKHTAATQKQADDVDCEDALRVNEEWYSLYAIILHTGAEATHGHFSLLLRVQPQVTVILSHYIQG